ncbi:hypothetical protein VTJ04DRAFT_6090 [Mycothermus thermophilus]|uniref:uncharacterized protein n=1 Tax=Humicola insolens TaxID=85995 RepID=UPI003744262E
MATASSPWMAPAAVHPPAPQSTGTDELNMQSRPMGLKVHYSFDRENQVHCLARWPHILQIQTLQLDEKTTIGVVDLRTCLQAVTQSSPELLNQQENDYSVYAYDYSEPDVPLVGHGMLSWVMDSQRGSQQQQLVTGRVTRNLLALLNSGSRDTLEVKLKFAAVARMPMRPECPAPEPVNPQRIAPMPSETVSEWNSFIQSTPMMGAGNTSTVSSPALPPAQLSQYNTSFTDNRSIEMRSEGHPPQPPQQQPSRPGSIPPPNSLPPVPIPPISRSQSVAPIPPRPQSSASNAPIPAGPPPVQTMEQTSQPRPSQSQSRPGSRSRSKQPTGRPRGRPRKRPLETGNTSAVEEATDGDEAPPKKRATVTRTEYSPIAPFGAAPESLRVAASTSGSLRTMRPVGSGVDGPVANHLQDVPRAPTPIPDRALLPHKQRRPVEILPRTDSTLSIDQSMANTPPMAQNPPTDARSPALSNAQSPDHGYSPEDSTGDLNSSPPVPRPSAYLRSSPPASSPTLPTLPMPPLDSGFMSGGFDDIFDDEDMLPPLSRENTMERSLPEPPARTMSKSNPTKKQGTKFPFHEVTPGPPELLPTKSIYNPTGKLKALNKQLSASMAQPMLSKPPNRPFNTSDAVAPPLMSEPELPSQPAQPTYEQSQTQPPQASPEPNAAQGNASQHNAPSQPALQPAPQPQETGPGNDRVEPQVQLTLPVPARPAPIPQRPEPEATLPGDGAPAAGSSSRPASQGRPAPSATMPTAPAREPGAEGMLTLPRMPPPEPPCPPSDPDPPRYSKNFVKKQSIKEKLQSAIEKGDPPPFCSNCGAIETPTWRKIWTQDHEGVPEFHEFSDKPGCVTMIEVLERDENEQVSKYRMVKKNLGPMDDKKKWMETLLCNPCGIWLGKFKVHRPPDRWDKDAARLNQPRKKKAPNSKSKKSRAKNDTNPNPTSEAYLTTDPFGPLDSDLPTANGSQLPQQGMPPTEENPLNFRSSPRHRLPGSTHSRGSGTADSPIRVEDEFSSTRRLLFPSPRRDGAPKTLGELPVNSAQGPAALQDGKPAKGKENDTHIQRPGTPVANDDDLEQELFGTPPRRPSTPPPKSAAQHPFKTPTRPTPNHRPITRSISRSIRSGMKSPSQVLAAHLLQETPTKKTPRSGQQYLHPPSSASKRRTPRRGGAGIDDGHFIDTSDADQLMMHFNSPLTATLTEILQGAGGGDHGDMSSHFDLDRDLNSFLSEDFVLPSSPPVVRGSGGSGRGRKQNGVVRFGGALEQPQQHGGGKEMSQEEEEWARELAAASTSGWEKGRK